MGNELSTEALGPEEEWSPVDRTTFQQRHNQFWCLVAGLISTEPGNYEDLPEWMTEVGSEALENN